MVWFRKTGTLVVVSSNWIFLYLRNYIVLQSCLQCCLWLINLTEIIPICKWMTKTPKATSTLQYHWLLKIKWQILFMGLSDPSFSQKVISNQWLPYISIKTRYLRTAEMKIHFSMMAWWLYKIYSPQAHRHAVNVFKDCLVTKLYSFFTSFHNDGI